MENGIIKYGGMELYMYVERNYEYNSIHTYFHNSIPTYFRNSIPP